ncbi:putative succinate dehydrogenase [Danaus plexippus plexippus]|uniref:Succinate dehydrogenase n=1 Tax=Danaus plexippus plexippus TaxID=278856 RepID=A0A212FKL0_DANPL|nr:putative succinate dehydrogenase [Danaus plexippus plexippus]
MLNIVIKYHCCKETSSFMRLLNKNRSIFGPQSSIVGCNFLRYKGVCPPASSGPGAAKGSGPGKGAKHKITYQPYTAPPPTCHDFKNMSLNRPMSPHLTIFAPTLPAMTSIVQRITGMIITFYALLLSSGSLFLSNGVETYVSIIQSFDFSLPMVFIIKMMLGAPFVYHYFNGIRFVMWNAGKWLSIKEVYDSAKKSFVATAVLTLLFSII